MTFSICFSQGLKQELKIVPKGGSKWEARKVPVDGTQYVFAEFMTQIWHKAF